MIWNKAFGHDGKESKFKAFCWLFHAWGALNLNMCHQSHSLSIFGSFPSLVLLLVHYPHIVFVVVFLGTHCLKSGSHKEMVIHAHTTKIQTRAVIFTPGMSHGRLLFNDFPQRPAVWLTFHTRAAHLLLLETLEWSLNVVEFGFWSLIKVFVESVDHTSTDFLRNN